MSAAEVAQVKPKVTAAVDRLAARAGMVAGAKALALTALDLLASPDALAKAKEEFTR